MKRELARIGKELKRLDDAGPYRGWKPYASETSYNTVNEWVRLGGTLKGWKPK